MDYFTSQGQGAKAAKPANPTSSPASTAGASKVAGVKAEDIATMSVKELKAFITSAGLGYADCVEKSDLRRRATEAIGKIDVT